MAGTGATGSGVPLPADFAWDVARLAFNPRGTLLAAGDYEADHVLVFDPRAQRLVARLVDLPWVEWLGFLSAEVLLVLQGERYTRCTRFDLRRGTRAPLWEDAPAIGSVAVAAGGKVAAFGVGDRYSGAGVVLFDVGQGQLLRRMELDFGFPPERLTFSARGRYVAADLAVHEGSGPRLVVVWEARTGRRLRMYVIREQGPVVVAFQGDTLTLAAHAYRQIHRFEPDRGEDPAATFEVGAGRNALAFRDGGETLAVLTHGGQVTLLRAKTGRVVRRIPPPAGPTLENGTVNDDWSHFAAATRGGVFAWRADPSR
jgi:hypothetical protein